MSSEEEQAAAQPEPSYDEMTATVAAGWTALVLSVTSLVVLTLLVDDCVELYVQVAGVALLYGVALTVPTRLFNQVDILGLAPGLSPTLTGAEWSTTIVGVELARPTHLLGDGQRGPVFVEGRWPSGGACRVSRIQGVIVGYRVHRRMRRPSGRGCRRMTWWARSQRRDDTATRECP